MKTQADALAERLNRAAGAFAARIGLTAAVDQDRCRYALIGVADGAVRLYLPRRAAGGIRSLGGSRRPGGDGETLADLHDVQAAGRERRDDGVR